MDYCHKIKNTIRTCKMADTNQIVSAIPQNVVTLSKVGKLLNAKILIPDLFVIFNRFRKIILSLFLLAIIFIPQQFPQAH